MVMAVPNIEPMFHQVNIVLTIFHFNIYFLAMSGKIPRVEALLRRMSGAAPTRCLTSPAIWTRSARHKFFYKTSKTAPFGAVFLIFKAKVPMFFCCNNDLI